MALAVSVVTVASVHTAGAAPIVPPSIPAGFVNTANTGSPLGTNLAPVTDFTAEYPFVDFFKSARPWISGNDTTFTFDDGRPLDLDADGNVRSLAADQVARTVLFTALPADPDLPGRTFVLRYDGDGDLAYQGNATVVGRQPGRDVIRLTAPAPGDEQIVILNLTRTNAANPLRNLRLVPGGGICVTNPLVRVNAAADCPGGDFASFEAESAAIVFNPEFLDRIRSYRSVRYMDWMRTNDSAETSFSDRPLPSNLFWSTDKGVPLEVLIALANLMDFDPWFNIPHLAVDDYVTAFATLVRDQLEPGRRAAIEYSNEVWNSIFSQTQFARDRGVALGLDQPENDPTLALLRFYSRRSRQVLERFVSVFGGAARLRRIMATQAVIPFFTETILGFENAAASVDEFAIAPYFGFTATDAQQGNELKRLGADGIFAWLFNDDNAILDFGSLPSLDRAVADQIAALQPFGIPLTAYEGGQTFLALGPVFDDDALNALLDAVNRDPRMRDVYLAYLRNWRARTNRVFYHYVNCDRWSAFGRWGALEFQTQPRASAPKYDALQAFIDENREGPPPLVACDELIPTIVGTDDPDLLAGTPGPDIIFGLAGNDTIRGRGGNDRICGGGGSDLIAGGGGDDVLIGGRGNDTLRGGGGNDRLRGGRGSDVCRGGTGLNAVGGCE